MSMTPLGKLYVKTWSENILFSVLVELTYRCNLDCFFCYNDLNRRGEPLSDEQYFRFFEDLAKMGVMNLTLSGGEPLVHPSFFRLGTKARELGFAVRIKSNGHLIRGELARRIKDEIDPFVIDISLHGSEPETHDRQTRVPGSFERLMENLEQMRRIGLRAKLNSTLTHWNESQIEAMYAVADRFGLGITIDPTVTPRDDGDVTPLDIAPSRAGILELYRLRQGRVESPQTAHDDRSEEQSPKPPIEEQGADAEAVPNCGAGTGGLAVDPYGDVFPCVQWRRSIGNLHRQSIGKIWRGSKELSEIRQINLDAGRQKGEVADSGLPIAHCMGLSEMIVGDPVVIDPQRIEQAKLMRQVRSDAQEGPLRIVY